MRKLSEWITLGEFAADGAIPSNDRDEIRGFLEESRWVETTEENGAFKARVTDEFMHKFNGDLMAATSQEERNEIFAKALEIEDQSSEGNTR